MAPFRRHPVLSAVGVVVLLGLGVVAASAVTVWRAAHHDDASEIDKTDVIIVLGAAEYEGDPSPVFRGRLDHAVLLWRQGRSSRVMVVGGGRPGDVTTEAEAGASYIESRGVPAAAVIAEPIGHTTFESLRGAARFMEAHSLRSAFLVSDPWHNARIERMASDLGIEGHASATWTSAARTGGTRLAGYARETFAYLYYRIFGR